MQRAVALALALPLATFGCRFEDRLLTGDAGVGDGAVEPEPADARLPVERPVLPPRDAAPPDGLSGAPAIVGCSDGSREAFLDLAVWPGVAGCAGAWQVQGVVGAAAATPRCARSSGDRGPNAAGIGCAAADLCAEGWHVCRSPSELGRRSPTGCESAVPPQLSAFYAIATGATEAGTCLAGAAAVNDLHGCGDFGQPEDESCAPLVRRIGFADCLRSDGIWACGTADDPAREAQLVTKGQPSGGGVICCRDDGA
jgi:hypothetical protein